MPLDTPLGFEAFTAEIKSVFPLYENFGIECSVATSKKIARLNELKSSLLEEEGKKVQNAVKIRKIKQDVQTTVSLIETNQQEVIKECFQIYINAFQAKVPMILGTSELRTAASADILINFGLLAHDESSCPATIYRHISETKTGGVFCPRSWSLLKNDSFILGALHAGHSFAIKAPLEASDLWDESLNRPKVLSREIACLNAAGYQQLISGDQLAHFGYLFEETTVPVELDLKNILMKVLKLHAISDVFKMLQP